ncbi:MAG: xanthine dehydrogenase family protein subunit M [Rhizomicrobium sp.]|jgi:carbon-monoxide dehydrogenase medium subunit
MIPYSFRYSRANSAVEAERMFKLADDATFLAGGQTLIPTMKQRLASPAQLIDISRIAELALIETEGDSVVIGAATTHAAVARSPEIRRMIPALASLAETIGDPAVRHRGTLGGSLANNDPAADYPAAVLALDASILTTRRVISADGFFTGMFSTALEEGELITKITFPVVKRAGYAKFRNPASRYAMAGVFVAQSASLVRIAVTGAGPGVFRVPAMEAALTADFRPEAVDGIAIDPAELNSDIHATSEYRAHLVAIMARRAVDAASRTD